MTLKTGDLTASEANRLVIWGDRAGSFRLSDVSLFPPTFNNRPNGNRIDLMEKLAALKPAFLRMPGGNYLDPGHYIWKDTIGPLQNRPGSPGAWSYPVTQGLGLLEMFEWCEDLHMTPVLAVSDGRGWLAANGNISPLVQDALDEIDYAVGPASSKWGAVRAQDGHPAPFRIKYVEIGNEDFFDKPEVYNYRFSKFYDAIRAKYPQLLIIATRRDVKGRTPDVVDEHYYRTISEMESSAYQYDDYPRKGPKIFVGEWASQDVDSPWDNPDAKGPTPSMNAALGDAAWLTGMERNCDIVSMESYAPLLTNVNPGARQWSQNLIGYDALSSFCSPSYYVQQMFANYRGAVEIPTVQLVGGKAARLDILAGGVGVGTWNTQAEFENPVVTRRGSALTPKNSSNGFSGWTEDFGIWKSEKNIAAQTSAATYSREATIHPDWTDYTYKVRARKTSGAEGFLIMFHVRDNNNFLWWNIGGWGNTRTQIERTRDGEKQPLGPSIPMKIDSGKWYDIEINVNGPEVSCYLDGKLIVRTVDRPQRPYLPIFSSASMNKMSGSIYLHLVNVSSVRHAVALNFGSAHISQRATGEILSGSPTAVNSLSQPAKVAPKPVNISNASARFTYNMPADSVNVIRFSTR
jgi:alpha-L-arabinofuranosidase